ALVAGTQAVSMAYKEALSVEKEFFRFAIDWDIQFLLKVVFHPKVVVANKEVNGNSTILYFSELPQNPYKSFRHHVFVLEPEIEEIAQKIDGGGIVPHLLQPFYELLLPRLARFGR